MLTIADVVLAMTSDFQPPNIAPQDDGSGATAVVAEAPPPAPITEQEVGEYREQDRFLPVCLHVAVSCHRLILKEGAAYIPLDG